MGKSVNFAKIKNFKNVKQKNLKKLILGYLIGIIHKIFLKNIWDVQHMTPGGGLTWNDPYYKCIKQCKFFF